MSEHARLQVEEKAIELVVELYGVAATFPSSERFELASQLKRAATSVPLNIAEGQRRLHRREFLHHLSMSRGSLAEIETILEIAFRLGFVAPHQVAEARARSAEVGRMLNGLIRSLGDDEPFHGR